jgi:hypothetical protein
MQCSIACFNAYLLKHCKYYCTLQLDQVEGWEVPVVLLKRLRKAGTTLRYSLRVSFYHAGSKRFYGNTFQGKTVAEGEVS